MRIAITYKDQDFIAIADGAGLDVEMTGEYTEEKSELGSELWNAIFDTRLDLHPKAEDHDTTPAELIEALRVMKLLPTYTEAELLMFGSYSVYTEEDRKALLEALGEAERTPVNILRALRATGIYL